MTTACAHCGLPVSDPTESPAFCCPGCRAVWHLMRDTGLGDFYTLRDRMGESGPGAPVVEVADADARYRHYDDPAFLDRFAPDGRSVELHVDGVHCAACVWVMEKLPEVVPGVTRASLDFGRSRLVLSWAREQVSLSQIAGFLHRLGYATSPLGLEAERARRRTERTELIRLGAMFAVAGNTMLVAAALYAGAFTGMEARFERFFEWVSLFLSLPAITYGAWPFYRGAYSGLKMGVAHIDLPIALGLIGGFIASLIATLTGGVSIYYDSVTLLVFLLLLGRFVQGRGQRAAMNRAEMLAALTPGTALRFDGQTFRPVPAASLRAGDRLKVRSGETLPVDGRVASGVGFVDQSLLSGESRPTSVGPGDRVFAGTVALGELVVLAEASGAETRIGRLLALIERAELERAPVVRMADRLSGRFVSVVIALAVAGGGAWAFVDPSRVFDVVVSLLVVSCPCALGLATPVALAVARGRAASAGILVRTTAALERLGRVREVVFDKTGTLTEGQLTVTRAWLPPELAGPVAALERGSAHPAARAVVAHLEAKGAPTLTVSEPEERPGEGLTVSYEGRRLTVGAPGRLGCALPEGPLADALANCLAHAETPVVVGQDGQAVGLLALGDRLRPESALALARLRALGLSLSIASGDHPQVVAAVARTLQVEDAHGGLSPEQKAARVQGREAVAMVGDGVNDAAALRAAGVGIAVHGGAEIALQVADLYLSAPGPLPVVAAIEGARKTLQVIHRNLAFSLAYNLLFAGLALGGLISPLAAAIIMPLSSLTVVGSSVLSRTFTRRQV